MLKIEIFFNKFRQFAVIRLLKSFCICILSLQMKKSKKIYLIICSILVVCTLSIVIACVILSGNNDDWENNDSGGIVPKANSFQFAYGDVVSIYLGDEFSLAPKNTTSILVYTSMDTDILSVSQDGEVTTKKCGETSVNIRNGTEIVKSVKVQVDLDFNIKEMNNCTYSQDTIYLSGNFATFNISLTNSKGEEVETAEAFEVTASSGIDASVKFGSIWLNASADGEILIDFGQLNYSVPLKVIQI